MVGGGTRLNERLAVLLGNDLGRRGGFDYGVMTLRRLPFEKLKESRLEVKA